MARGCKPSSGSSTTMTAGQSLSDCRNRASSAIAETSIGEPVWTENKLAPDLSRIQEDSLGIEELRLENRLIERRHPLAHRRNDPEIDRRHSRLIEANRPHHHCAIWQPDRPAGDACRIGPDAPPSRYRCHNRR